MLGREDLVVLANFSQLMAEKMDELILHVRFWINSRIETSVTSSHPGILHRCRLPIPLRDRYLDWDPALSLGLEK